MFTLTPDDLTCLRVKRPFWNFASLINYLCIQILQEIHFVILQEMKDCYKGMAEQARTIGIYFSNRADATVTDLAKRQGTTQKRAYRIPFAELSSYTASYIKYGWHIIIITIIMLYLIQINS